MNPHHLHATAAAWSLHTARTVLAGYVQRAARRHTATLLDAAPVLTSPAYGDGRYATGGHGDPTGLLLIARRPTPDRTWADRRTKTEQRTDWLADTLRLPYGLDDGLARIIEAIPTMQPGTARVVGQHLADEDELVRDWCDLPAAGVPFPGECPAAKCRKRELRAYVDGPVEVWTVACTCRCVGAGCGCRMKRAVEGVVHIWPRTQVLGAIAAAA